MQFNSILFFLFLILFFSFWHWAKRIKEIRWTYLIVFSFLYYGIHNILYFLIFLGIGLLDFWTVRMMKKKPHLRKTFFIIAVCGNVFVLFLFKYIGFFKDIVQSFLVPFGIQPVTDARIFHMAVPLGISFFVFQSLTYIIDGYRQEFEPVENPLHLLSYLTLFPLLLSGPIARAKHMLPQLNRYSPVDERKRWEGFQLIITGLFKKMVIADNLAPAVSDAFTNSTIHHSFLYWWLIILMYSWQIYYDFSGYTDVARGLGKWMGLEFPINFSFPYFARSVREFWNRWHISLSQWLRDYIFLPLSYSILRRIPSDRQLKIKAESHAYYPAILATMVLCGLWHGAALTFVFWGGLHGLFICLERIFRWPERVRRKRILKWLPYLVLQIQILLTWVFFRSASLDQASSVLSKLFKGPAGFIVTEIQANALIYLGIVLIYEVFHYYRIGMKQFLPEQWHRNWEILSMAGLVVVVIFLRGSGNTFIYFGF